ncbi:MAG: glycosyltransferase family 10 [Pseudomonadota bacterium]
MRIKFVSKTSPDEIEPLWAPLLQAANLSDDLSVTFDPDAQDYDFLIVYEDLPPRPGEKKIKRTEKLACAKANTLLITTEPASIRIDGPNYIQQFGAIWTSRPTEFTPSIQRVSSPPPLRYFHGRNLAGGFHRVPGGPVPEKSRDLSAMSSKKAMDHTLHSRRLAFILDMKSRFGDALDLFGRGFQPVDDKAEAMDAYRYHIAVENHQQDGHITEKLTDCFLAGCLPFYFGAPDYADYFPKDAVIPIDIFDPESAETTIRSAIESNAFEARRPAIEAARKITLKNWNTVGTACDVAKQWYDPDAKRGGVIHGRHAFRRAHPIKAVQDALFVMKAKRSPLASPLQT